MHTVKMRLSDQALRLDHLLVETSCLQQVLMLPFFHYPTLVKDEDSICFLNARQAMGNHDRCPFP
jgi:hypothetical protein